MSRVTRVAVLGLLLATTAAASQGSGCAVPKGLYDEWLALAKRGSSHKGANESLLAGNATYETDRSRQITKEYQTFLQCLSDTASQQDGKAVASVCNGAADRLASLVCQTALYLGTGRTATKDFGDAIPPGKKGADLVWDLDAIAGIGTEKVPAAPLFRPEGPAYKVIDELFVLALDGAEGALAKYLSIAASAPEGGSQHIDGQIKILLMESPAVVIKEWPVVRQYLPRLKRLVSSLPPTDLRKLRQGMAGFCAKDNLDCPEILKTFGRP